MDAKDQKDVATMIQKAITFATRFSKRKIGDMPTDSNQLTPRGYVNMYGSIAGRPASVAAVIGQQYFNTTDGLPIFFNTNNQWVNATGSVVATN